MRDLVWWLIGGGGVLAVLAIAAQIGGTQRRRSRAYSRQEARHVLGDRVGYTPAPAYGSMILAEEQRFLTAPADLQAEYELIARMPLPGWREQTEAALSPEALEPPRDHEYTPNITSTHEWCQKCDSVRVIDSGPGAGSSLAPGPDQAPALAPGDSRHDGKREGRAFHGLNHADDGWLDRQLAAHLEWVARMAPMVTGWSVAA